MSDDGYLVASPYDEYDDYFDEDSVLGLADDLAQHATYSPVWQDTPTRELELYHSDWEYYSDDYYDDDPALLETNSIKDGTSGLPKQSQRRSLKRGRKRKLDEAREGKAETEAISLLSTIRGTVWAKEEPDLTAIYREGEQEKVALLVDWKDVFREATGIPRTFGRGQLDKDESWANDMSLAAMGLHNERRHSEAQHRADISKDDVEVSDEATVLTDAEMSVEDDSGAPGNANLGSRNGLEPGTLQPTRSSVSPKLQRQLAHVQVPAITSIPSENSSRPFPSSSKRQRVLDSHLPSVSKDMNSSTSIDPRQSQGNTTTQSSLDQEVAQLSPKTTQQFRTPAQSRKEDEIRDTIQSKKRKKSVESDELNSVSEGSGRRTRSKPSTQAQPEQNSAQLNRDMNGQTTKLRKRTRQKA